MHNIFDDEERIEKMIAGGKNIVSGAIEQYKPIAILSAYSGGNDSIVSTHFGCENYGALAIHCETSIGLEESRNHVISTCERFKWDLRMQRAQPEGKPNTVDPASLPSGKWCDGETAYEEFVLNWGFPGPGQHGRMFQRLKQRPIAAIQRELKAGQHRHATILIISGIRHDESAIRAGYKRAVMKESGTSRVWVNPFYWNTALDFELYRQEFGLPRNPVKACIGISGECLCGAFAKKSEKEAIRSVCPKMGEYLDQLESRVKMNGLPWGWGEDPPSWFYEARSGQQFLFDLTDGEIESFRPMCVGCNSRRNA